ncbi:hypothetical protein [Aquiflexum lacus]|uniref:hypothetical protein n=1 Tax=Aquiflexum lacus TaxID=2483805 RepID=UPI00189499F7|nr:hypothetical protein [Aquiflexum lacus]
MNKTVLSLIALMLLGNISCTQAQDGFKRNTVFGELAGPGGLFSLNYDLRFGDIPTGFGMRTGVGYFQWSSDRMVTIPLMVNWLLGANGKYLELGAGLSLAYSETFKYNPNMHSGIEDFRPSSRFGLWQTPLLNVGYRRQPIDGGFNFRAGLSPFVSLGGRMGLQVIPWPYLSFGLTF